MALILVALLTLLCQKVHHSNAFNSFAGPYIVVIEDRGAYSCELPNNHILWGWHWRTSHFNPNRPREKQLLTGNITGLNVTLDDSWSATVSMDSLSNNQWKENALVFPWKRSLHGQ
ncbi:uncharacterized protein LOC113213845 isoform X2 [Frankliniella occidentalis]|uniref:Uncharacterized protein LOC113213845 isoform X2 n=1 Tax=Frankliniella occidentalis TaxID=133901 RepID=A0A9C6X2B3_FRAOC|nr:uncharacterized protein LOC113213845 isoform X2 [Frankliniella occidentalis]